MTVPGYNRLRGRGLYLEVRDLIKGADAPLSNNDIRDQLMERYQCDDTERDDLYERVRRATEQLLQDGFIQREEGRTKFKTTVYNYTHKPDTCSSERK